MILCIYLSNFKWFIKNVYIFINSINKFDNKKNEFI